MLKSNAIDPAAAARAERLRQQIEELTKPSPDVNQGAKRKDESPREFIQRRMRELDQKE
jgi:hypothetical protein